MTLINAVNFFEKIKKNSTKKSELKIYNQFITILKKLELRDFNADEIKVIELELQKLNLKSNPDNRKIFFKKTLTTFKSFLKNTFSLTSKDYYTNTRVSIGILFGVVLGVLLGQYFEKSMGLSIGICTGMFVGAFIGKRLDNLANEAGNIL